MVCFVGVVEVVVMVEVVRMVLVVESLVRCVKGFMSFMGFWSG